ncbi:tetratricopeptide repeat protein [candidate division WOR-3 bacterium]|nr:tetratricopeptide repeat protein [candidate division WOR-3 bacterium]
MFEFILGKDINKILEKSRSFEDQGENKKALSLLERESRNQEDYNLYLELGRIQAKMNIPGATKSLTMAHMLSPENIINTISRAEDGFFLGDRLPEVGLFIGSLYLEQGDYDKAKDFLKETPKDLLVKEIEAKKQILKNFPQGTANLKKRSSLLFSIASLTLYYDRDSSMKLFEDLVSEFPDKSDTVISQLAWMAKSEYRSPTSHIYLGKFQLTAGKDREGLESFQRALQIDTSCAESIIELMSSRKDLSLNSMDFLFNLYISTNNQDKALELVNKSNLPKETEAKYLKSMLQTDKKNIKARLQYIEQLIAEKKFSEASTELEFFSDKSEYIDWVSEKLDILMQSPDENIYNLCLDVYVKKGDFDKAVDIIEKLLKNYPESADRSESLLIEVIEQNIENHRAIYLLGKINASRGNLDTAIVISDYLVFSGIRENTAYSFEICSGLMERFLDNLKLNVSFVLSSVFDRIEQAVKKAQEMLERDEKSSIELLIKLDVLTEIYPEVSPNVSQVVDVFTRNIQRDDISMVAQILASIKAEKPENALKFIQMLGREHKELQQLANELLKMVSEKFPKNKEVLKSNIIILLKKKNLETALNKLRDLMDYPKEDPWTLDLFKKLKKVYPDNYQVLFGYLDFLLKRKLFSQLDQEMEKIPEKLPLEDKSYFNIIKGQASIETGNYKNGLNYISNSLDLSSKHVNQAIELLEKVSKVSQDPKTLYILSKAYSKTENYEKSSGLLYDLYSNSYISPDKVIKVFQSQLQQAPTDANLRFYLGKILSSEGELDKASTEFQLSVSYDESYAQKSLEEMEKIISNSDSEKNLNIMVEISDKCQKYDALYSTIKKILSRNPSNNLIAEFAKKKISTTDQPKAIYRLIWSEISLRNDRFDEAKNSLVRIKPENPQEREILARQMEEIIENGFLDPNIFFKHAEILVSIENNEKAVESFSRAFELNPNLGEDILPYIKDSSNLGAAILKCFIMHEKKNYEEAASMLNDIKDDLSENQIKEVLYRFSKLAPSKNNFDLQMILLKLMLKNNLSNQVYKKLDSIIESELTSSQKQLALQDSLDFIVSFDKKKSVKFLNTYRKIIGEEQFFVWANDKRLEEIQRAKTNKDHLHLVKLIRASGYPEKALELLKNDNTEEALYEKCLCYYSLGNYPLAIYLVKKNWTNLKKNTDHKFTKLLISCHLQMSDYMSAFYLFNSFSNQFSEEFKKVYGEFAGKILSDNPPVILSKIRKKECLFDEKTIQKAIEGT